MFVRIRPEDVEKSNLVVVAPTGSGKTTAIINALKSLVPGKYSRAFIVLPTRASVHEIYEKAVRAGLKVGVDTSDARLDPFFNPFVEWQMPVMVTTYEKLDSVIMMRPEILDNSILVIDEAHNLTSRSRSMVILDLMAEAKRADARIVLLSATMPETEELARYLDAKIIRHNERPVELEYKTYTIYGDSTRLRQTRYYEEKISVALGNIVELVREGVRPILVYAPSRRFADRIAVILQNAGLKAQAHHAGYPANVRKQIEEDLRKPNPEIDVVVATDTLAQSVNLRFQAVVILGMRHAKKIHGTIEIVPVSPETLAQVAGRAGRPGMSSKGYVFFYPFRDEYYLVERALAQMYEPVQEPADYPALYLRLVLTGRDPAVWAKYAYKVDGEKLLQAPEILRVIDAVDDEGQPTKLGALMASSYSPSTEYHYYYNIVRNARENPPELSGIFKRVLTGVLQFAVENTKYLVQARVLSSQAIMRSQELETLIDETFQVYEEAEKYSAIHPERPETEKPTRAVLAVLLDPYNMNTDMLAEKLKHVALVLEGETGKTLPVEYRPYYRLLKHSMIAYRRLISNSQDAGTFLYQVLSKPEDIARAPVKILKQLDMVFLAAQEKGLDLGDAVRKLTELERGNRRTQTTRRARQPVP